MRVDWRSMRKHYTPPEKGQFPIGSRVYIGRQGKGKTLSMSKYVFDLLKDFPDMKVFSNVLLFGVDYTFLDTPESVSVGLAYRNGSNGVLVLLDEAHLYFHTKQGVPLDVLTSISQQRKDRRRIVFSSQIWNELDISLRKQVTEVVDCRNFGRFQMNTIYDGATIVLDKSDYSYRMKKLYRELYKHNDEYYKRYDTYQKIVTNENYDRPVASAPVAVMQSTESSKKRLFGSKKGGKV